MILTTLHSGGKFSDKAYATSGGLHGVGVSRGQRAVDRHGRRGGAQQEALPPDLRPRPADLEAGRDRRRRQNRRGTTTTFIPDPEIFGEDAQFKPARLYRLARSKAYLFAGVEIRWRCDPRAGHADEVPGRGGVPVPGRPRRSSAASRSASSETATNVPFTGRHDFPNGQGSVEWAVAWPVWGEGDASYYCNTIPTPDGGTHEQGFRAALTRGLRAFGELVGQKKAKDIQAEDVVTGAEIMLSVFIRDPQFQSQTKDRLTSPDAARLVETAVRDHFDHFSPTIWSAGGPCSASCSTGWTSG